MNFDEILTKLGEWCMNTGIKVIISIIILIVSFKLINHFSKKIEKKNDSVKKLDKTLTRALLSAAKILLKVLVVLCIVNYLGIDTSGVTALIASLGVCVGLAVNGALGNIAGGVLLLITRPFKVDDYIEVAGYSGTVEEINICSTKLITPDNRVNYIPNGTVSTSGITNYSEKPIRRVDQTFTIPFDSDFELARNVLLQMAESQEAALKDPAPAVLLSGSNANGNILTVRAWAKKEDYWTVFGALGIDGRKTLAANGFTVPGEQLEVHIAK